MPKLLAKPDRAVIDDHERQADRHQPAAIPAVGEPAERDAEQGVEDGEGGAVEEADLGVVEVEVALDVLGEDREDLPVDEIDDVDQDEDEQGVPGIGADADGRGGRGRGRIRVATPYTLSIVLLFASG